MTEETFDGEVVVMPPANPAHAACVNRLTRIMAAAVGDQAIVSVQNPLVLDERSEVRPDLVLLRPPGSGPAGGHPTAEDVLLLVEVSESSLVLTHDRGRKAAYYARCHIPECWVVDLVSKQVHVLTGPASGGYREMRQLRPGNTVTTAAVGAGLEIAVADLVVSPE